MTFQSSTFDTFHDISDLGHHEWCAALDDTTEELGYFEQLGTSHAAAFCEGAPVLLVEFVTRAQAQAQGAKGYPTGFALAQKNGWSSLSLIAHDDCDRAPWFRDPAVYAYFDRLVDDGFFDDFERVVFVGAAACGYAAATYSVTAPGASVIAIAPQATLNARLASWDDRFPQTRRLDFTTRYGFAPHMIDGAAQALVLYDPENHADAMHAALFHRPNVSLRPVRHTGDNITAHLSRIGVTEALIAAAMAGDLDTRTTTRALRLRHNDLPYLRVLLAELQKQDRPLLTARLCRFVLRHNQNAPRFRRALKEAMKQLETQDRSSRASVHEES